MTHLVAEMGKSFVRAFVGSLIILAPGVLNAPNKDQVVLLGIAALIASLAAGIKAIQVFVPQLTFSAWVGPKIGPILDSFVRAFVAAFLAGAVTILSSFDLSTTKAAVVALLVAAVTAGIRAVQGFLTVGEHPAPQSGLKV